MSDDVAPAHGARPAASLATATGAAPHSNQATDTRVLRFAAAAALALLLVATALRLAGLAGAGTVAPDALVPPLLGIAGLCVVGLAFGRSASIAWLACVFVGLMAAITLIPVVAAPREAVAGDAAGIGASAGWPLTVVLRVTLLAAPLAAAAYASHPRRRLHRWVPLVAWGTCVALAMVLVAGLAQLLVGAAAGTTIGLPRGLWLAAIALLAGLGIAGDVAPAVARTRRRVAEGEHPRPGPVAWLRLLAAELWPGRDAARAEAAERERGRLASDLHAEVLPALRRALATAEAGGSPERLAADLRGAVDDVEGLLAVRRSIVLEELGLVAALEWLAERVEERSDVRVELLVADAGADVDGAMGAGGATDAGAHGAASRAPRAVERAAFRIAQLALDNVARHAGAARAEVEVAVGPGRVRFVIADDGPGLPRDRDPAADGRRGIADMREEARACGASLALGAGAGGRGTVVAFDWPA